MSIDLFVALAALVLKAAGMLFLFAASLGLLRFKDPLQRMHAATKAGTLGAGLTVAGAALASGDGYAMAIGALAVIFLIFTVPVAAHLLGRAIYFSNTPLHGLAERDALGRESIRDRAQLWETTDHARHPAHEPGRE